MAAASCCYQSSSALLLASRWVASWYSARGPSVAANRASHSTAPTRLASSHTPRPPTLPPLAYGRRRSRCATMTDARLP